MGNSHKGLYPGRCSQPLGSCEEWCSVPVGSRGSLGLEAGGLGAQGHHLRRGSEANLKQEDSCGWGESGSWSLGRDETGPLTWPGCRPALRKQTGDDLVSFPLSFHWPRKGWASGKLLVLSQQNGLGLSSVLPLTSVWPAWPSPLHLCGASGSSTCLTLLAWGSAELLARCWPSAGQLSGRCRWDQNCDSEGSLTRCAVRSSRVLLLPPPVPKPLYPGQAAYFRAESKSVGQAVFILLFLFQKKKAETKRTAFRVSFPLKVVNWGKT